MALGGSGAASETAEEWAPFPNMDIQLHAAAHLGTPRLGLTVLL